MLALGGGDDPRSTTWLCMDAHLEPRYATFYRSHRVFAEHALQYLLSNKQAFKGPLSWSWPSFAWSRGNGVRAGAQTTPADR